MVNRLLCISDNKRHTGSPTAFAAISFLVVVCFQLVFEWLFGDPIDARYLFQAVLTSEIMTVLLMLLDRGAGGGKGCRAARRRHSHSLPDQLGAARDPDWEWRRVHVALTESLPPNR